MFESFFYEGTAHIVVHKQNEHGILEEILPSTAGPFGGESVDRAFEDLLESIIGSELLYTFKKSYFEDLTECFDEFQAKKHSYDGGKMTIIIPIAFKGLFKRKYGIELSHALEKSQYKGEISFKNSKLNLESGFVFKMFYKEAIAGITNLIQDVLAEQVCADLKHIIMVGGFSESKIIQRALQETFQSCIFHIPDRPVMAVSKGAVFFGHLPTAISGRFARFTYGVKICRRFKPGEDPESKKIVVDDELLCQDVFFPLVGCRDEIQIGEKYSYRNKIFKQNHQKLCVTVFITDDREPKFTDDEGCKSVASLTINIMKDSEKYAEIEQTIIFDEVNMTFRATQCGSNTSVETSIDMLDEANVPEFLHK